MIWKKLWLLFTVIWVIVAGLQVGSILVFSPDEQEKALLPLAGAIAVPLALYALGLAWQRIRKK